jgi:hypothetical protein
MVSINTTSLERKEKMFRSFEEGESRAPVGSDAKTLLPSYGRKSGRCAASECHLICKDIWTWRLERQLGNARIYLHPGVKLYYNHWSKFMHTWISPVVDMVQRWRDRGDQGDSSLASFHIQPPSNVRCGGGDDECGDSGRVLVPDHHPCRYV